MVAVTAFVLAGCATTQAPEGPQQATRGPQIGWVGDEKRTETIFRVRAAVSCEGVAGDSPDVWLEALGPNGETKQGTHEPCVLSNRDLTGPRGAQELSVTGLRRGVRYTFRVLARNSHSLEYKEAEEEALEQRTIAAPASTVGESDEVRAVKERLSNLAAWSARKRESGKTFFESREECDELLLAKKFEYYEPKLMSKRNLPKVRADDPTRELVRLAHADCAHMETADGMKYVVLEKGTVVRAERRNGRLEVYAHNKCGNLLPLLSNTLQRRKEELEKELALTLARQGSGSSSQSTQEASASAPLVWGAQKVRGYFARVQQPVQQQSSSSGFCEGGWRIPCGIAAGVITLLIFKNLVDDGGSSTTVIQQGSTGGTPPGITTQPAGPGVGTIPAN